MGCGEAISHYETRRVRKDGTLVDVSLAISPILDRQGAVVGASTIARDVTARKQPTPPLPARPWIWSAPMKSLEQFAYVAVP